MGNKKCTRKKRGGTSSEMQWDKLDEIRERVAQRALDELIKRCDLIPEMRKELQIFAWYGGEHPLGSRQEREFFDLGRRDLDELIEECRRSLPVRRILEQI